MALAILLTAVAIALTSRPDETAVLVREPVTFNLIYGPQLQRVDRPGALVALRHERNGLFLDAYTVRELTLPAYRGAVGGMLPVYADALPAHAACALSRLRARRRGPRADQQRDRLRGDLPRAHRRAAPVRAPLPARRGGARGLRRGVILEIESTPAAGTPNASEIGNHGALKTPLRSFRFGADRKGGTA